MLNRSLAHYRVTELLGKGGMGEVYRAVDERLEREVALKLLPAHVAADPSRLARFRREAQTLASLNHRGIGAIYGLEEDQDTTFLVLELVEGEDLSERLARGALPVAEALDIAVQMASALEVAHERGIIHRDLKPSNVKLGARSTAKILDFGLAKIYEPTGGGEDSHSPTAAIPATEIGAILGTAAYMAPEQAQGQAVDKRADIWAFGVVLFEMLTGERLFAGSTFSETVAAVLAKEVDWDRLPANTPARVRRVLERCLRRDPLERLRDIGEARIRLSGGEDLGDAASDEPTARSRLRPGLIAAAGIVLVVGGWLLGRSLSPTSPAGEQQPGFILDLELEGLAVREARSLEDRGAPQLSPDGRQLLYLAADGLRIRRLTELDARPLPESDGASYAFWSPDSRSIAYVRLGRLWRRPASGGPATDLGPVPEDLLGSAGGAWDADERLVLAGSPSIGLVGYSADGRELGDLAPLGEGEADYHEVSPLPDGRGFVFTVHGPGGIDSISALVDGQRKELLRLPGEALGYPSYSPSGYLLYERRTTNPGLWAVRLSLGSVEVAGTPFPVIANAALPAPSDAGSLLFLRRDEEPARIVRASREGLVQELSRLAAPAHGEWLGLSPDGRRVALPLEGKPYGDLWVVDLERGTQSRLDSDWVGSVRPVWTPDGRRVVYASHRGSQSTWKGWIASASGTAEPEKLQLAGADIVFPLTISPDGEWLVFIASGAEEIYALRLEHPSEKLVVARGLGRGPFFSAEFSPDGGWLAYQTGEAGSPAVWVQPFPPDGRRWPVSTEAGEQPRWSASGAELFYRSGSRMMAVQFEPGAVPNVSRPVELFTLPGDARLSLDYQPVDDGQGFLMIQSRGKHRTTLVFDLPALLAKADAGQRPVS